MLKRCSCGWCGTTDDLIIDEVLRDATNLCCPACNKLLDVIPHGTGQDRAAIESYRYMARFHREKLSGPDQLPEIQDAKFALLWDFDRKENRILIRHNDTVIFSEPAIFEGFERFGEVAEILKKKYGERLQDMIPTEESWYYLFGDRLSAPEIVDSVRQRLFSYDPKRKQNSD